MNIRCLLAGHKWIVHEDDDVPDLTMVGTWPYINLLAELRRECARCGKRQRGWLCGTSDTWLYGNETREFWR